MTKRGNNQFDSINYDYVKQYIAQQGYMLISTKYINARNKLEIKCNNNHCYFVTFDKFHNRNQRCPICETRNKKYSVEYVEKYLKSIGYVLLTTNYINCKSKIAIRCPNGHVSAMAFDGIKNIN